MDELIKTLILNAPSLIGLLIALVFSERRNEALLEALKDCTDTATVLAEQKSNNP